MFFNIFVGLGILRLTYGLILRLDRIMNHSHNYFLFNIYFYLFISYFYLYINYSYFFINYFYLIFFMASMDIYVLSYLKRNYVYLLWSFILRHMVIFLAIKKNFIFFGFYLLSSFISILLLWYSLSSWYHHEYY